MKILVQSLSLGFLLSYGLYFLTYLPIRHSMRETLDSEGRPCVVFPSDRKQIYFIYKPAMWVDERLTRTKFYLSKDLTPEEGRIPQ